MLGILKRLASGGVRSWWATGGTVRRTGLMSRLLLCLLVVGMAIVICVGMRRLWRRACARCARILIGRLCPGRQRCKCGGVRGGLLSTLWRVIGRENDRFVW